MRCHYTYGLYAEHHSFILRREDEEEGSKRFATIFDAIAHIENLPESEDATVIIHNQLGHTMGRLHLNCGNAFEKTHPASSREHPSFRRHAA